MTVLPAASDPTACGLSGKVWRVPALVAPTRVSATTAIGRLTPAVMGPPAPLFPRSSAEMASAAGPAELAAGVKVRPSRAPSMAGSVPVKVMAAS